MAAVFLGPRSPRFEKNGRGSATHRDGSHAPLHGRRGQHARRSGHSRGRAPRAVPRGTRPCAGAAGRSERQQDGAGGDRDKKAFRHADDWPLDRFSVVGRAWEGCTAVCFAGGPSLDREQAERCRAAAQATGRIKAIGVNDAYLIAPWADVLYFADARWWQWHREREEFKAFAGAKVTIENNCGDTKDRALNERWLEIEAGRLWLLHQYHLQGALSSQPNALATGQNGGYQAINLAVLLGVKKILLLGYDMKPAPDGRMHWFGDHPVKSNRADLSAFLNNFRRLAPELKQLGVEVVNCTPESALDCFPQRPLEEELARLEPDPHAAALPA